MVKTNVLKSKSTFALLDKLNEAFKGLIKTNLS